MTSYVFRGAASFEYASSVSSIGDFDGDGRDDLLIGAAGGTGRFESIKADDVDVDHIGDVKIDDTKGDYVKVDDANFGEVKVDSTKVDDIKDREPIAEDAANFGKTYLIPAADLDALDGADGNTDGVIDLSNHAHGAGTYVFYGIDSGDASGGAVSSAGDVNGDGKVDLLIGAPQADGRGQLPIDTRYGFDKNKYWHDDQYSYDRADLRADTRYRYDFSEYNYDKGEAYLVLSSDLSTIDAADKTADRVIDLANVSEGAGSYVFYGATTAEEAGTYVKSAGDVDGDGKDDLLIGAAGDGPDGFNTKTYLLLADDLEGLDRTDRSVDGAIELANIQYSTGSYVITSLNGGDSIGHPVSSVGDVDGDGKDDLLIGAPTGGQAGEAYLMLAADLENIDIADEIADGVIQLDRTAYAGNSYVFSGIDEGDDTGRSISNAGDVDGDGKADLFIGAANGYGNGNDSKYAGEAYLVLADDLATLDFADGKTDYNIDLANLSGRGMSYIFNGTESGGFAGRSLASAGDVDGDGKADLLIGFDRSSGVDGKTKYAGAAYLVLSKDLAALDAESGPDGTIELTDVTAGTGSYVFYGTDTEDSFGAALSSAGDVDGDGKDDLLFGAIGGDGRDDTQDVGETYLFLAKDLADADAADGKVDFQIDTSNIQTNDTPSNVTLSNTKITENAAKGTVLGTVSAIDDNEALRFELIDDAKGTFAIDEETGTITVADNAALDFETNESLAVTVKVSDFSGASATETVKVTIADENDTVDDAPVIDPIPLGDDSDTNDGDDTDTMSGGGDDPDADVSIDDLLVGSNGADSLSGGAGNDTVLGAKGADTLSGNADADTLKGANGADILLGGNGGDLLFGGRGDDTVSGGVGADKMHSGSGDDIIEGGRGMDTLCGGIGDDTLLGGNGSDTLKGAGGIDKLFGGNGSDLLFGGARNDRLWGNKGNDTLAGGAGDDRIAGGAGIDVAIYVGTTGRYAFNELANGKVAVSDTVGGLGIDTLTSIEKISINGTVWDIDDLLV